MTVIATFIIDAKLEGDQGLNWAAEEICQVLSRLDFPVEIVFIKAENETKLA